jgi:hypothetical protein
MPFTEITQLKLSANYQAFTLVIKNIEASNNLLPL